MSNHSPLDPTPLLARASARRSIGVWRWVLAILTVVAVVAPSRAVLAAGCPTDPAIEDATGLDSMSIERRQAFLDQTLERSARRGRIWAGSWGATFGVAAVTSLSLASVVDDPGLSIDLYVTGASASLGLLVRSVMIPAAIKQRRRLRKRAPELVDDCARLQATERALVASARWEQRGRSILLHAISFFYSASVAVVHGVVLERPFAAGRQFMIGGAIGQVQVLTTPQVAVRGLRQYRAGPLRVADTLTTSPMLLSRGFGVSVGGRF